MTKPSIYALIDCNNFFVSCERVFRPDLWNKPVAVLSNNDGCIVARSNEVKAMGVPMGVPYFQVKQALTQNKVELFSGNFRLYGDFSHRVVQILQDVCPEVEVYSVDEAFLQLSGLQIEDYAAWGRELRQKILQWTGIPVSIGIAPTKTLAKSSAEYAKKNDETGGVHSLVPDKSFTTTDAEERRIDLLKWLNMGDVWGVGRRTAPKLQQMGISNAYQLTQVSERWVQSQLSIRGLKTVKELKGEDCLGMHQEEPQQSIARTRSFGHTIRAYHQLEGAIASFTAQAAARLRDQAEVAQAVMVFLRTPMKSEVKGSSTVVRLQQPTSSTGALIEAALRGLGQIYDADLAYKKGGVVLINLASDQAQQLSLLEGSVEQIEKQDALMKAIDEANQKFGTRLIKHAAEHLKQAEWHSKRERRSPAYTTAWADLPQVKLD